MIFTTFPDFVLGKEKNETSVAAFLLPLRSIKMHSHPSVLSTPQLIGLDNTDQAQL